MSESVHGGSSESWLGVPVALVGSIALVLGLYSLAAWVVAERTFQPYRERGLVCTGHVMGKSERVERTRTGASSHYTLRVAFDFAVPGRPPALIHTMVSEHVYYPSYNRLHEGDEVELLVLPERPDEQVMLREVVEGNAYRPVTLRPWTALILGLVTLGCFLLFRRLS